MALERPKREYRVGDRVLWYDVRVWDLVGHDFDGNEWCFMPATVITTGRDDIGQTVSVKFDHDGFVAREQFAWPPYGGPIIDQNVMDTPPGEAPRGKITKEWVEREMKWHEREMAELKRLNSTNLANRRRESGMC